MKKLFIMNYIATIISNLSNGYIHLYWTGPSTFTSYGKYTGRCSIESKNDGWNIISSLHIISTIFVSSLSMWSICNLLEHISLKKWLIFVSVSHISFGNKSRKANKISVCINTWQSWLFIPYNLHSSILTSLEMFEACPLEKHRLLSHLETSSCVFFSNMKLAIGFATHDLSQTNSIFLQLQNNVKSNLALMLSFFFPFTSMTVLKMYSKTFFLMCITLRLWRRRLIFQ